MGKMVYRTQVIKSPLTCILHSHTLNNEHLFTQKFRKTIERLGYSVVKVA